MKKQVTKNQIKKEYGEITVDSVGPNQYKNHVDQAQIRQVVKTTYPGKRVGNSNSDVLFSSEEYNLPDGQVYESVRVTWIDIPKGATKEQVIAKLATLGDACIRRIISNNVMDVLTEEQKNAIVRGLRTIEDFKESFMVKDGNGNTLEGTPQYRQNFFSATGEDDTDLRTAVPTTATTSTTTNVEAEMHV